MNKKLYVGGLPYSVTDDRLHELFSAHGTVESANVITDRSDIQLEITTEYTTLWEDLFTDMAEEEGIIPGTGPVTPAAGNPPQYQVSTSGDTVTLTIYGLYGDLVLRSTVFELETI